jgi:cysteinyl-tRNA synthetase
VALRLYDSSERALRTFDPLTRGRVGIYLCGATVQDLPHVGHLRSALAFDILVRWLRRGGLDVTLIRNVTDIDDKILAKSSTAGVPWWAWAQQNEQAFTAAYDAVGLLRPTYEPRATGHVTEMVELMQVLVERGHAYPGEPGNVYFDVRSFPEYGSLTRQRLENMSSAEDAEGEVPTDKRDPRDFALWKRNRPGEPPDASWPTPYGRGRPGWHLECSAMARRYLGDTFDIHGGGIDLRFPHHENEQAQSRAAGLGFARHWVHNAWVTVGGEKMSKSLGNSLLVDAVLHRTTPVVLRYALGTVHYRSTVEFSDASLEESRAAWERVEGFVRRAVEQVGGVSEAEVRAAELPTAFTAAMDDDLNVSAALAVVHDELRSGNTALAEGRAADARLALTRVRSMLDVLGLDPLAPPWAAAGSADAAAAALRTLVDAVLEERVAARAARDWRRADTLREQLTKAGIVVEDAPSGARWSLKG